MHVLRQGWLVAATAEALRASLQTAIGGSGAIAPKGRPASWTALCDLGASDSYPSLDVALTRLPDSESWSAVRSCEQPRFAVGAIPAVDWLFRGSDQQRKPPPVLSDSSHFNRVTAVGVHRHPFSSSYVSPTSRSSHSAFRPCPWRAASYLGESGILSTQ